IFIKQSSQLQAGDTLVIRFRLFSDPYANGWGWGIEDFNFGPLIDNVDDITHRQSLIYPNPGNGILTIHRPEGSAIRPARYTVLNSAGTRLLEGIINAGDIISLDISGYPTGIYFIILHDPYGSQVLKYSLIR